MQAESAFEFAFELSSLVWTQNGSTSDPPSETLVADIGVRRVWKPQVTALFNIRIVDTDAPSYSGKSTQTVLRTVEREK